MIQHINFSRIFTIIAFSALSVTSAYAAPGVHETPTGFDLQAGNVTDPAYGGGNNQIMSMTQTSDRAVINWDTFNVGEKATVRFNQTQGSGSVVVNRVTGATIQPTEIFGKVRAAGTVMILDRNGVLFGENVTMDVGGLIASTGKLGNQDQTKFMNGQKFRLKNIDANENASIINNGTMNIRDNGLVAFVAPYVHNNGVINAKMGRVELASGKKVVVDFAGDDLIQLVVKSKIEKGLVENAGTINAQGGRVAMTANAAAAVVDDVINMNGVIKANSFSVHNGEIILSSIGGGNVKVDGTLDVSRPASQGGTSTMAGSILIEGKNIIVTAAAKLLAELKNETSCWWIFCSTKGKGNGGTINVAATDNVTFAGTVDATGGVESGSLGSASITGGNLVTFENNNRFDANFTTSGDIVSFNQGFLVNKDASFNIASANTINLGGKLQRDGFLFNETLGAGDLFETAQTVNVLNDNASMDQGFLLVSTGGFLNIGSGTYVGNVNINKSLTFTALSDDVYLVGGLTTNGVVTVNADNVTVDGFDITGILAFNGIHTDGHSNVTIRNNNIHGFLVGNGVYVNGGIVNTVSGNVISSSLTGVNVQNTSGATVSGNDITDAYTGIYVNGGSKASVSKNVINGTTGGNGIDVNGVEGALIAFNRVFDAGNNGVNVIDTENAAISFNKVVDAENDGLFIDPTTGFAFGNVISGAGHNGITVDKSPGFSVKRNVVTDSGKNGIVVLGSKGALISSNYINGAKKNGIKVRGSKGAKITSNFVADAKTGIRTINGGDFTITGNVVKGTNGGNGIDVNGANGALVKFNRVTDADANGISIIDVVDANISWNTVAGANGNGIYVDPTTGFAAFNTVSGSGINGIFVEDSPGFNVFGNFVSGSTLAGIATLGGSANRIFGNTVIGNGIGILVETTPKAEIFKNFVFNNTHSGILVRYSSKVQVLNNWLFGNGSFGILAENSDRVLIDTNVLNNTGDTGISVTNSYYANIKNNIVNGGGYTYTGINLYNSFGAKVKKNTIADVYYGIAGTLLQTSVIKNNKVSDTFGAGIFVANSKNVDILKNKVKKFYGAGVQIVGGSNILIQNNKIKARKNARGTTGILIGDGFFRPESPESPGIQALSIGGPPVDFGGVSNLYIYDNVVKNANVGLSARAFNNGYIDIAGNTFTNNTVGSWIGSGVIDLRGDANTFIGGDVAMRFAPAENLVYNKYRSLDVGFDDAPSFFITTASLSLMDESIGSTVFEGQSTYYVDLQNGAFFAPGTPTIIDGLGATYDGVSGGLMTFAQLTAIESMINDYDDDATLGNIFTGFVDIDDNLLKKKVKDNSYSRGRAAIIIRNTPRTPDGIQQQNRFFSIQDLANLEPAAGGDDPTAEELANLEPAAGSEEVECWANAAGATGTVSLNLSNDPSAILAAMSGCSGGI